jgi:hypothetical protein
VEWAPDLRTVSWFGPAGVFIDVVDAGFTMTESNLERFPQEMRDRVVAQTPTRRLSVPEDVASLVVFLASAANTNTSGEIVHEEQPLRNRWPSGGMQMPAWMNTLVEQVSAWPSVCMRDHRFGGIEFRVGAREIGHLHAFGIVDIPFTVKIRDALVRSGNAERHHWLPDSGWTTIRVEKHGLDGALKLLRLSYLRIQAKSADIPAATRASLELREIWCEDDIP